MINELLKAGCGDFVVCGGARNAGLVALLEAAEGLQVWKHFEERGAAFFALGRAKDHGRPCAVVTTSGTAVAECLPAVIEAHYTCLPLIVLSADRPEEFRGSGAPQVIGQATPPPTKKIAVDQKSQTDRANLQDAQTQTEEDFSHASQMYSSVL